MNLYKDIIICCSFEDANYTNEKESQYNSICNLGGDYRKDFTTKVTHLIAKSPETKKYKWALKLGIPVLNTDWIKECLLNQNEEDFNPYTIMQNYLVLPLNNYIINIIDSSNDKDSINYLIKIVEMLGGTYEEQLNTNCTHVITNNPNNKISDILRKMNIKIITPEWIYKYYLIYVTYIDSKLYKNNLKLQSRKNNYNFFMNKTFYLSENFSLDTKKRLLKIILNGKGKCNKTFTKQVTTFIIKDQILDKDDKKLLLQSSSETCTIINYTWLLKCYIDKCYIPESYYELLNVFQSSSSLKGSLFKGLTFYIYNFDKVKKNRLEKIILIQQGSIYNPDTLFNANDELLIVTSFTKKFDPSIIGKFSIKTRVITNYWVEKCFLKKKIYDFDKYPMFIPCSLENGIND